MSQPLKPLDTGSFDRGVPVSTAASIIGCDDSYIRRLIRRGQLRAYRVGRGVRVYLSSIDDYRTRNAIMPAMQRTADAKHCRPTPGPAHWEAIEKLRKLGIIVPSASEASAARQAIGRRTSKT